MLDIFRSLSWKCAVILSQFYSFWIRDVKYVLLLLLLLWCNHPIFFMGKIEHYQIWRGLLLIHFLFPENYERSQFYSTAEYSLPQHNDYLIVFYSGFPVNNIRRSVYRPFQPHRHFSLPEHAPQVIIISASAWSLSCAPLKRKYENDKSDIFHHRVRRGVFWRSLGRIGRIALQLHVSFNKSEL